MICCFRVAHTIRPATRVAKTRAQSRLSSSCGAGGVGLGKAARGGGVICWWGGVGGRGGVDRRPGRAGMEGSLCVRKGWRATFVADGRCSFVATFAAMYLLVPQLNRELRALLSGRMPLKFIMLSAVSEGVSGRPCTDLGVAIACAACVACIQVGPAGASRERPPRVSATLVVLWQGSRCSGFTSPAWPTGCSIRRGSCMRQRHPSPSCST